MPLNKRQSAHLDKLEEWKEKYESGMSYTEIGKESDVHYSTVQRVLKGHVKPRPKKKFAHKTKRWVELYTVQGLSSNEIAELDKVDTITVIKYLKEAGVELRRQYGQSSPFEQYIPIWIELYESGKSLKEIADQYETYPQTVHKQIKDKVDMREYIETSRTHTIENLHYLDKIEEPNQAYWLGVWYATGFIYKSVAGYETTLVVGQKDEGMLEKFQQRMGYHREIERNEDQMGTSAKLRFNSKHLYDTLVSHGLVVDKVENIEFPLWLPTELYGNFLLGYYEGKGSCFNTNNVVKGKTYTQTTIRLYGSDKFLNSIQKVVEEQIGVSMYYGEGKSNWHGRGEYYFRYLTTGSRGAIKQAAEWMYKGVTDYSAKRDIREYLKR